MSLQVITPPAAEPVTLDEVKARLRLTSTDDDATILQNITSAREFAQKITRMGLAPASYMLTMDRFPWPHEPLRIPNPPLVSVDSVSYYDETMTLQPWANSDYFVAANNVPALIVPLPGIIYPSTARVPGAVQVTFTSGYGAVDSDGKALSPACPEHLKEGIRQMAMHIYEHPEAVTSERLEELPLALRSFFGANKVYVF